ncbi:hypothetical protein BJ987_004602 [Nocardia goodfellowii]|uniref:Uncharacterized protein n=1 Tax=Nocardia goodfellowii TaxID=882446 RepID=A0ABS4QJ07_9NOCA|nr:hypothetical protein [Nocardia goodfellowii]
MLSGMGGPGMNGACAVGAFYIRLRAEAWTPPAHRELPITR